MLAAQLLTWVLPPESRPLPELQAPELAAGLRAHAHLAVCHLSHPAAFTPALTWLCPPSPLFGLVLDAHRGCWFLSPGHPPGWPWQGGFPSSLGSTWSSRVRFLGAAPGMCRGQPAGQDPPCRGCRGCAFPALLLEPSVCAVLCQRFPARGFRDVWPRRRCLLGMGLGFVCFPHPAWRTVLLPGLCWGSGECCRIPRGGFS